MKRCFLVPILILALGIAACSPVTETLENHTLGATVEQAITIVDAKAELDADTESETDSEELSPGEDIELSLPEITPIVSAQNTVPEQKQDTIPKQHVEPTPTMPIITEMHQGYTYRPGQVIAVLAEGFEEGDTLVISLIHEDQGQIDTFSVSPVSPRGNIPIYLPVEIEEAGTYPDGEYTFRVSGSDGKRKTYTFFLDYLNPAETAPFEGCGVYPEPVLDSIVFVWCTGYDLSAAPLEIRGEVNGEELFTDVVETIYSDGVTLYVLDIFDDDPAGEWTLEIGQDELTFEVSGDDHE